MTIRRVRTLVCLLALLNTTTNSSADPRLVIIANRVFADNQKIYGPGSYTRSRITLADGQALLGLGAATTTITADSSVIAVPLTGNPTITFTNAGITGDTITRSSGSWITDGFVAGQTVWVTGAATAANNTVNAQIASVSTTELTLGTTILANETNAGSMTGNPNLTFSEEGTTGDKITRPIGGNWVTDGFVIGQEITVTGTTSNNVTDAYVIDVSATELTLWTTDLAAEGPINGVTVKGKPRVRGLMPFAHSANFGTAGATGATGPIAGLTLDGNLVTTDFPYGDTTETHAAPVANGAWVDSEYAVVADCRIKGFRGYGAGVQRSVSAAALGMMRVDRNVIHRCFSGIQLPHPDMSASHNVVAGCRDFGLHVLGGPSRSTDNHCYGMKYACYLESAPAFNSANDMFADSEYGVFSDVGSNVSSFINTRLYHNFVRGAKFAGTVNTIVAPQVDVPNSSATVPWPDKVGIEFSGASNTIMGGLITLDGQTLPGHGTATASTAVRVSGNNCRIKDLVINDLDNLNGSKGLHIPANSAIRGGDFEYRIYGFEGSGDAALDIDDNNITGVTVTIVGNSSRSPGFVYNDAAQYVDIPAGWGVNGNMTGSPSLTFEADDDTITRSGGSWVTDGFNIGETVTVTGTTSNNITGAAITNVTATVLTLGTTSLTDETDGSNTVISVNGTTITIKDESSGQAFPLVNGTAY